MELEDWSVIKQKSLVWKRLISKNLRGHRQVYCAAEFIRSPMPKVHLLRFGVWERWEKKLNGIQRRITRNWIASTVCRRSSSGKYFQDSRRWSSSKRLMILWKMYSVNLSSSTTGSSSRQCTTTSCDNCEVRSLVLSVGLSWDLDQKRSGTGLILVNQTENGTELQKWWCSNYKQNLVT